MMKRLAAAGIVTTALGGALLTASPALANGDEHEIHQEKVLEANILCNIPILAVQKDGPKCGGSEAEIKDKDEHNHIKIKHHEDKKKDHH